MRSRPSAAAGTPGAEGVCLSLAWKLFLDGRREDAAAVMRPGCDAGDAQQCRMLGVVLLEDRRPEEAVAPLRQSCFCGRDDDPCTAHAGWLVAGRGDVDWDGNDDFLVGSSGPGRCGKLYLVFGADPTS